MTRQDWLIVVAFFASVCSVPMLMIGLLALIGPNTNGAASDD